VQRFERGVVVSWAAGMFPIPGPLYEKWAGEFATRQALPLGKATAGSDGDRQLQQFAMKDGSVWTLCQLADEAFWVAGRIRDKWYQLGALHGVLGVPVGNAAHTADGRGLIQQFSSIRTSAPTGAIVFHPLSGGPFAVNGDIYRRWERGGFERGVGLPESDALSCGNGRGRFMDFGGNEPCRIYLTEGVDAVLIPAPFLEPWLETGGEAGVLGHALGDTAWSTSTRHLTMVFEHGLMWASPEGIRIELNELPGMRG
jgi:uncharacterized protein with LGFP repeats